MKRIFLFFFLLITTTVYAVEDLTLNTPITKTPVAKLRLKSFSFDIASHQISITLLEPTTGETFTCNDDGNSADNLISNINTRDFSGANISLHRRLINAANNRCPNLVPAGTFSGTPQ